MSVTHKKSEKQIGAAELEALRASIMAEVEAARAETEESIISSIRNNLVSIPEQGEEWNEKKSYITGDVVTLDGVSYTATHYSRGKSPASQFCAPAFWKSPDPGIGSNRTLRSACR